MSLKIIEKKPLKLDNNNKYFYMKTYRHFWIPAEFLLISEMFQVISNNVRRESFLSLPQPRDRLWVPRIPLVTMNWTSSGRMNRPRRETDNSPVSSAQVIFLSTKFP